MIVKKWVVIDRPRSDALEWLAGSGLNVDVTTDFDYYSHSNAIPRIMITTRDERDEILLHLKFPNIILETITVLNK